MSAGGNPTAGAAVSPRRTRVHYFESDDLARFPDVGKFKPELMEKFFAYYHEATGAEGALSAREKALIALAVAHAKGCPYCIDAFTTRCLETGSNPEQMTEAVHVAAAMSAGVALVHGVQMHNAMHKLGAL